MDSRDAKPEYSGRGYLLPPPPAYNIGRDAPLQELVTALLTEPPQPIAVLGALGVGKSHLALHALHDPRLTERYGPRRYFVRCDIAATAEALLSELARTLAEGKRRATTLGRPYTGYDPNTGYGPGTGYDSALLPAILDHLRDAPTVVLLDNAETLLEDDSQLQEIEQILARLTRCPGVALLSTLRGNKVLPGLAWRQPPIHLHRLDPPVDRELFLRIAGQELAQDPRLDDILSLCDGLPAALELLARRAQGSPDLAGLWQAWQTKRSQLLRHGDGRGKHNSLQVSFELSVDSARMTVEARQLLRLLSQLPDGIARVDLQALLPGTGLVARDSLLHLGLACAQLDKKSDHQRIRMHAPIRQAALQHRQPEIEEQQRLVDHYLHLVRDQVPRLGRPGGHTALERLAREVNNIEVCLAHDLAAPCPAAPDPEAHQDGNPQRASGPEPFETVLLWGDFLRLSSLGTLRPLEQALHIAERRHAIHLQARLHEQLGHIALLRPGQGEPEKHLRKALIQFSRSADTRGQATCLHGLGHLLLQRSRHASARRHYERALRFFLDLRDTKGQADCLKGLGDLLIARSDQDGASLHYRRALDLYRADHDLLEQANCLHRLGDIQQRKSRFDKARELYELARDRFDQVGPVPGSGSCLLSLGDLLLMTTGPDAAREHYQRAQALFEQLDALGGKAECRLRLGHLERQAQASGPAAHHYEQAQGLFEQLGDSMGLANCRLGLARVALDRRQPEEAARAFEEARQLFAKVGDHNGQAICLHSLGDLQLQQAELTTAKQTLNLALKSFTRVGSIRGQGSCLLSLGEVARAENRLPHAQKCFEEALTLYFSLDDREAMAQTYPYLARIATDETERRTYLRAARGIWEELGKKHEIETLVVEFGAADVYS